MKRSENEARQFSLFNDNYQTFVAVKIWNFIPEAASPNRIIDIGSPEEVFVVYHFRPR
jgi:hypothetical protein